MATPAIRRLCAAGLLLLVSTVAASATEAQPSAAEPDASPAAAIADPAAVAIPTPEAKPAVPEDYAAPPPDLSQPARFLFGARTAPSPAPTRSIGSYARGCLAGAVTLPVDGPDWQVMRLSRNRNWGHPKLVDYLERLAGDAPALGWNGLLVGDMSQPRGGPMITGHASHQIGLDADIWFLPMPDHALSADEREEISAIEVTMAGAFEVDPAIWTDAHNRLLKRAASDPDVARIFVSPGIKRALCEWAATDRGAETWLRRIRPWYGHKDHLHVRLTCPAGDKSCRDQSPPPAGSGCGSELAWWFTDAPYKPKPGTPAEPKETMLADLPAACRAVLLAD
ncbi:penicillin-insensitive murein endopeptidase [Amorphus suaedae]